MCFVYHAVYKHVPIIENNAAAGIYNNVFGTPFLLMKQLRGRKVCSVSTDTV